MVKIEVLFSEVCNLYGDLFNIKYLERCLGENCEIYYTNISDEPKFVKEDINMIYMAPMTERTQELVIKKLLPYKERVQELIDKNVVFLLTGNAPEVFGKYIENEDGIKIEALGILDLYAKRNMMNRHSSMFLGKYEDIEIIGYKDQFTMAYSDNSNNYFAQVIGGIGLNKESKLEGIKINNLIATYVLGPILIFNPLLTKKILAMLGIEKPELAYEKEIMDAYNQRLEEVKSRIN